MHICIVGTGAAGWMTAAAFINAGEIVPNYPLGQLEITVIGSPEIPPIGVGESNTLLFSTFQKKLGLDISEFITRTDATIKTGVLYDNWSPIPYLHNFKGTDFFEETHIPLNDYLLSFSNTDVPIQDYFGYDQYDAIMKNQFHHESSIYPFSFHFDAGKYIKYMAEKCMPFVNFISDTVVAVNKTDRDSIHSLQLTNSTFSADYYIFATGTANLPLNQNFVDLSNTLLTNKAWVYPLEYTNKREQFTPYTRAKTMKYGWRWITPTYSRVGTGYVFSDQYVSSNDALYEFLDDIGDHSIEPRLVDFHPQYSSTAFHLNYCTIGMASGFLEPLDAPGLTLSIESIILALHYTNNAYTHYIPIDYMLERCNRSVRDSYIFWTSFILAQYKTCYRNDTKFWIDHKNVNYEPYDDAIQRLEAFADRFSDQYMNQFFLTHGGMFVHTMAGKGHKFNVPNLHLKPFKMPLIQDELIHHLDYIESHHKTYHENMLRVSDSNDSHQFS